MINDLVKLIKQKNHKKIIEYCQKRKLSLKVYNALDDAICDKNHKHDPIFIQKVLEDLLFNYKFRNVIFSRLMLDYLYESDKTKIKKVIKKVLKIHKNDLGWRNLSVLTFSAYLLTMKESKEYIDILVEQDHNCFSEFWAYFINPKKYKVRSEFGVSFLKFFVKFINKNGSRDKLIEQMWRNILISSEDGYLKMVFYLGIAALLRSRYRQANGHFNLVIDSYKSNNICEYELSLLFTNIIGFKNFPKIKDMMCKKLKTIK